MTIPTAVPKSSMEMESHMALMNSDWMKQVWTMTGSCLQQQYRESITLNPLSSDTAAVEAKMLLQQTISAIPLKAPANPL